MLRQGNTKRKIIPPTLISERSVVPASYENGSVPLDASSEQRFWLSSAEENPSGMCVCDVRMGV